MADRGAAVFDTEPPCGSDPNTLGEPIDFDVRGLGRRLPRTQASEGWVKKIERHRQGKVWVGFFHLWMTEANGQRVRRKKEKTLGPASMPEHEAQSKLAEYIEEYIGRLAKRGSSITSFAELWDAFYAVKSGRWSKKTKEDLQYLFAKHVVPIVGHQPPREAALTPLQLLLNKMAEDDYCKSAAGQVRTYIKGCFEYAVDEGLVQKNPARKLVMPNIRKKPCERFSKAHNSESMRPSRSASGERIESARQRQRKATTTFQCPLISGASSQRGSPGIPTSRILVRFCSHV